MGSSSQSLKTSDLLLDLGFRPVVAQYAEEQPGYCYDFGNLRLVAARMTSIHLQQVMHFSGVTSSSRAVALVEFELPLALESYEQGVSIIAYNIGRQFTPLRATPWLDQGRAWEEHLPHRRQMREYEQRPQCRVEADWFRVAAKRLIAVGEAAETDAEFGVSYRNSVLKFELPGQILVMPAEGQSWTQVYRCRLQDLRGIRKRTPSRGVLLSVWEGRLEIGGVRLAVSNSDIGTRSNN